MDFWFREEAGTVAPALVFPRNTKAARQGADAGESALPYARLCGRSCDIEIVPQRVPDPSILI